ncbi:MAG TPA: hypothetical protein O0X86_04055 [Methanocorpusculum sp.]|nr:hypothetical protein [Methanocorpusculum sp.]
MTPETRACIERQLGEISSTLAFIRTEIEEIKQEQAIFSKKIERVQLEIAESRGGKNTLFAIAVLLGGSGGAGVMAVLLKLLGGGP